jgi:hypothetical protein
MQPQTNNLTVLEEELQLDKVKLPDEVLKDKIRELVVQENLVLKVALIH